MTRARPNTKKENRVERPSRTAHPHFAPSLFCSITHHNLPVLSESRIFTIGRLAATCSEHLCTCCVQTLQKNEALVHACITVLSAGCTVFQCIFLLSYYLELWAESKVNTGQLWALFYTAIISLQVSKSNFFPQNAQLWTVKTLHNFEWLFKRKCFLLPGYVNWTSTSRG